MFTKIREKGESPRLHGSWLWWRLDQVDWLIELGGVK